MKIILNNFKTFATLSSYEVKPGLTLISGPSGVGKSTLLEAILWAINGGPITPPFANPHGRTKVKLELTSEFSIIRTTKPSSIEIIISPKTCLTSADAEEYLERNLNSYFYLRQNSTNSFLLMKPCDRISFIEKLAFKKISSTQIDAYREKTKSLLKLASEDLVKLQVELEIKQQLLEKTTDFQSKVDDFSSKLKKLQESIQAQKLLEETKQGQVLLIEQKYKKTKMEYTTYKTKFNSYRLWLVNKEREQEINADIAELQKALEECFQDQQQQQHTTVQEENIKLYSNYLQLQEKEQDYRNQVDIYNKSLANSACEVAEAESNWNRKQQLLEKLEKQKEDINNLEFTSCPACHQLLQYNCKTKTLLLLSSSTKSSSILEEDIKSIQSQIEKNTSLCVKLRRSLDQANSKYQTSNISLEAVSNKLQVNLEKQKQLQQLLILDSASIDDDNDSLLSFSSQIKNKLETLLQEKQKFKDICSKIKFIQSQLIKAKSRKEDLVIKEEEEVTEDELRRAKKIMEELEADKLALHVQLENIQTSLKHYNKEAIELEKQLQESIIAKQEFELQLKSLAFIREKIAALETRIEQLSQFQRLVKESVSLCLKNTCSKLERAINYYCKSIFETQCRVSLELIERAKKLDIDIKIDYNGHVYTKMSVFSGGECQRLILAFHLAINNIVDSSILILDETLSNLDSEASNRAIKAFRRFIGSSTSKRIIVVAHQTTVGLYDQVIEL